MAIVSRNRMARRLMNSHRTPNQRLVIIKTCLASCIIFLVLNSNIRGDDNATPGQEASVSPIQVAAVVDGEEVFTNEVDRQQNRVLRKRKVADAAIPYLRAEILRQLVHQRIVLQHLEATSQAVASSNVDLVVQRMMAEVKSQKRSWDQFLVDTNQSEKQLRRQLTWELTWRRYLDRFMNEKNQKKYFESHRREFDGTQLRVSHILLPIPTGADKAQVEATRSKAASIHKELESKSITFADAAAKYSAAPTADKGGDIGWIRREEPMPNSFSRMAFETPLKKISSPVRTSFGFHLIHVTEEKPGKLTFEEVADKLKPAVRDYIFQWLVDQRIGKIKIDYTGHSAYFKDGTRELSGKGAESPGE